jgi:hypothetical protein
MLRCSDCHHHNKEGVLFCEDCGAALVGDDIHATQSMVFNVTKPGLDASHQGTEISTDGVVFLRVRGAQQSLPLAVGYGLTLGRHDPDRQEFPDVDLVPYGASEKGVSRFHAQLDRYEQNIYITDLGSTNGTYLNGERLVKERGYMLRDGDEIRLAKLALTVYFKAHAPA